MRPSYKLDGHKPISTQSAKQARYLHKENTMYVYLVWMNYDGDPHLMGVFTDRAKAIEMGNKEFDKRAGTPGDMMYGVYVRIYLADEPAINGVEVWCRDVED
jgi:hypothetical protein